MAAIVWELNSTRQTPRWIWAAIITYLTTVMAMGIHVPFVIPAVLVVVAFGLVVDKLRRHVPIREVLGRLLPMATAAVVAGAITGGQLRTKASTAAGFLSTAYPGERLTATGTSGPLSLARTVGFSFSQALDLGGDLLGINSSEASTFFLIGAFLIPIAIFVIWREARPRVLPWALISLISIVLVFLAFMVLPGWNPAARLLLLDRSTPDRVRISVRLATFALLISIVRHVDDSGLRVARPAAGSLAGLYLASQVAVAVAVNIGGGGEKLWGAAPV